MTTKIYAGYHQPGFFFFLSPLQMHAAQRSAASLSSVWSGAAVAARYWAVNRDTVLSSQCEPWAFEETARGREEDFMAERGSSHQCQLLREHDFLKISFFWRCLFRARIRAVQRPLMLALFWGLRREYLLSVL